MKYLCTIYGDEGQMGSATPEQVNEMLEAYGAFGQEAGDAIVAGEGLQPTSTATTVRVREGERMLTDGPFAETKEQLGGFYLLECNGLDEAIELAAKIPGAQFGSVEVRPVMNYEGAGSEDAQQSAAARN
ncbi:MAG TPA: YciI family protein [Thermoleophilaceae bacterium]|nr:YciI family protein [Thermoleophilaceae bacterium]